MIRTASSFDGVHDDELPFRLIVEARDNPSAAADQSNAETADVVVSWSCLLSNTHPIASMPSKEEVRCLVGWIYMSTWWKIHQKIKIIVDLSLWLYEYGAPFFTCKNFILFIFQFFSFS